MSRSSRRKARAAREVPADVVRHSPVFFDDGLDLPELREGAVTRPGVPQLSALVDIPLPRPRPALAKPAVKGVWGKRASPMQSNEVDRRRLREYRRVLFNRLAIPFSRRADVCVKRKQRREVIFAKRFNGRNGAKSYRRTYVSAYSCR